MKTVEMVLKQLGDMYEFNKRLKTYRLQQPDARRTPGASGSRHSNEETSTPKADVLPPS